MFIIGRYTIQLISVANLVAKKRKSTSVSVEDIKKVYQLFFDEKRSCQFLAEYQEEFMFNDQGEEEETAEKESASMETN